jgi:hypothetical protein
MKIFKYKKLNQLGFAHDLMAVGVVVVLAVVGAGYLVASHAATCPNPASAATSSSASGPTCTPTSSPVSATTKLATCVIENVPTSVGAGVGVTPTIVVTNIGTGKFSTTVKVNENNGHAGGGASATLTINPGKSKQFSGGTLYGTSGETLTFTASSNKPSYSCTQSSQVV